MIKKILVAIDGSEHADKALDFALGLAEKCAAEIVILNVFQEPIIVYPSEPFRYPVTYPASYPVNADFIEEVKKAHRKMLSEALRKARRVKPDLKMSTKLKEGRPSDKIVETAREGNFDIIIMGHRGLGRVKEFFLGSVCDRVADEAHCPVLIVK
jgi:nucleotide-binding universal stress UspA family protein